MAYITLKWLKKRKACKDAVNMFIKNFGTRATVKQVLEGLEGYGGSWLAWIMGQDDLEITRELIKLGANIHACGDYALSGAAENGHLDIVKFLKKFS